MFCASFGMDIFHSHVEQYNVNNNISNKSQSQNTFILQG